MKKNRLTQKDMVIRHLNDFGTITSWQAFEDYGITRLAAIIFNIKNEDKINIKTNLINSVNRYGNKIQFAEYSIVK